MFRLGCRLFGMKTFLYIDESYGADHYYVSGLLMDEEVRQDVRSRLGGLSERIAEEYGLESPPELHAHAIMQGCEEWTFLQGDVGARIAILRRGLIEVANAKPVIVTEGVDVERLNARYRYPDSPYEVTLRHMLERVNDRCERFGNECAVYADMISRSNDFIEAIDGYTHTGTPGYRSSKLQTIEQPINYLDSKDERAIQAADLVAYITRRVREETGGSKKSVRAAKRLYGILEPVVYHERKWVP